MAPRLLAPAPQLLQAAVDPRQHRLASQQRERLSQGRARRGARDGDAERLRDAPHLELASAGERRSSELVLCMRCLEDGIPTALQA